MTRTNPLKVDALTADTVAVGDRILVWVPNTPGSARHYTVLHTPRNDDDGTMVIDLCDESGRELAPATSEVGLTGGRYDGVWTHIAIIDDQDE